ncbi:MAG: hypothetical protein MK008_05775 [Bdellovibrionales bacterium]|nr:hypothetical protein [Bdellovibrionales bacterium]
MSKVFYIVFVLLLSACGGGFNPDLDQPTQKDDSADKPQPPKIIKQFSGQKVELLNSNNLVFENQMVQGTGLFKFTDSFERPEMGFNFNLDFELDANSEVRLISFADENLNNGVELIFTPKGDKLKITFQSTETKQNLTPFFRAVVSAKAAKLSIDIHNDHSSLPHIIIWDENTHKEVFDSSLAGRGFGKYWGLELVEAKVNFANVSEPKDDH